MADYITNETGMLSEADFYDGSDSCILSLTMTNLMKAQNLNQAFSISSRWGALTQKFEKAIKHYNLYHLSFLLNMLTVLGKEDIKNAINDLEKLFTIWDENPNQLIEIFGNCLEEDVYEIMKNKNLLYNITDLPSLKIYDEGLTLHALVDTLFTHLNLFKTALSEKKYIIHYQAEP